jgi:hypothetical protein
MKLMVIPVGRSLVYWPRPMILCINAQADSDEADGNTGRPQPGFFRITGKKYFVLHLRWLGEGNFLVQISCGGSVIGYD